MKLVLTAALLAGLTFGCSNNDPDDGAYGNTETNTSGEATDGQLQDGEDIKNGQDGLENDMNNQTNNDTVPGSEM